MKIVKYMIITNLVFFTSSSFAANMGNIEWGINRAGADYKSVVLPVASATLCQNTCASQPQCRSWTLTRESKKCWLKTGVPTASNNDNTVSGVKVVSD